MSKLRFLMLLPCVLVVGCDRQRAVDAVGSSPAKPGRAGDANHRHHRHHHQLSSSAGERPQSLGRPGAIWTGLARRRQPEHHYHFANDVTVEGQPLSAGTYGLHMIPNQDQWTIIFSKMHTAWGSFSYKESEDALRITVKPQAAEFHNALAYDFDRTQARFRRRRDELGQGRGAVQGFGRRQQGRGSEPATISSAGCRSTPGTAGTMPRPTWSTTRWT